MAHASKNHLVNDFWISLSDLAKFLELKPEEVRHQLSVGKKEKWQGTHIPPQRVRELLLNLNYKFKPQVISFQMLKGGVSKTTSAMNLGLRAAMYGARVLFIDLDQQANLTFALGCEEEQPLVWLDVVEKKATAKDCVLTLEDHIDLIPSSLNNSVMDKVLMNSNRNWVQAVKTPLENLKKNYDLIIIDTAPALSAINTAVCVASDKVILPVNPDRFSMLGLEKNLEELIEIKKDFDLTFAPQILFTKFDGREKLSHELLEKCIEKYDGLLMNNYIRVSSEVKNSIGGAKNIFQGKSSVKEDFDLTAREMLEWATE